ncbi:MULTISPECIES: Rha family transcriptional regulator [unclassified Pseudomonas]|uniref:Rha family transcriptional regulator n=1 Tax=unclassified Pseudomonas TaxID=196821 RepID=UPI00385F51E4
MKAKIIKPMSESNVGKSHITLTQYKGEPRADSRTLAEQLDNDHDNVIQLLKKYPTDFKQFGILRFETGVIKGRGQPEQFAHLNEDQCYLLLAYSRNTAKVRALKINLVKAFREARDRASVTDNQYLPFYHAMHEEVAMLAQRAKDLGSHTPERVFHINANKALNTAMGIASGQRGSLDMGQRLILTTLQAIYRRHLHQSIESGADHREAGRKAKAAVFAYMETAGALVLGVAA